MRLLRLLALCLGVFLSAADANGPRGCVITEMNNDTVELKDETRKPFYLWPGSSLSSLSFTSFLNATGGEEVVETVNLKNETRLLPEEWNKIEFSTTKTNDRSSPSVSIPAINVTRILRNCSNCSLKELQIKVEGRAMLAFNCSNNTKPTSFFADHRKDAISAEVTLPSENTTTSNNDAWRISLLLLLPICFLSVLRNIWTSVRRGRRSAGETARRQEDDLPLVSLGAQDLPPPVPPCPLEFSEEAVRRERGMRGHRHAPQSTEGEHVYEEVPVGAAEAATSYESVNSIYGALP